ncbi:MAG: phosphatidate cytidylyltransferase, partial [Bacteroidales bacterium]
MNNLIVRTVSGIIFIIIMTFAILWSSISYFIVFGVILFIMMNEYLSISMRNNKNNTLGKILGCSAGVFFFVITYLVVNYNIKPQYLLLTFIPLLSIFIVNLYVKNYNIHNTTIVDGKEIRTNNGYEIFPFILSAFIY